MKQLSLCKQILAIVIALFLPCIASAQAEEEDAWMDAGAEYAEYEAYQYEYQDGAKSMVDRLPVYESMDISSPVLLYIPYGEEFKFNSIAGDQAWIVAVYNGVTGCALKGGCSFNGVDEEKGKAWFEEQLRVMTQALSKDPYIYQDDYIAKKEKTAEGVKFQFLIMLIGAIGFVVLQIVSRRLSLKWSYFVAIFGCGACLLVVIDAIGKSLALYEEAWPMTFYVIVLLVWAYLGRRYFAKMALDTRLSNEFIKLCLFATVLATMVWVLLPLCNNMFGAFVVTIPLWIVQSPTRHRCPRCHHVNVFYWNRKEKAGTHTELTNDLKTSGDTMQQQHGILKVKVTKRIYDTSVYQMWRHYHKCSNCGYEESKRRKGERLSVHRVTKTETESTRYPY